LNLSGAGHEGHGFRLSMDGGMTVTGNDVTDKNKWIRRKGRER
jgi:hypothetical protein